MKTWTIFKRELSSYFTQPTAYAVIIIFGLLSTVLAFAFGHFWQRDDASLGAFWQFLPLLLMILVPAVSMKQWSDENSSNTIELLGTMPLKMNSAVMGKFLAAALVWLVTLSLTFPMVWAVNHLGEPDNWIIASGYIGTFLVCLTFIAITTFVSAFTRDEVVALIVSVAVCCLLSLVGFPEFINLARQADATEAADIMTKIGIYDHFFQATTGKINVTSLLYFCGLITVCLVGTNLVLKSKRS